MEIAIAEQERLAALRVYAVLDTLPEESFDRLTQLAAELFDAPIALISLIDEDRQWFKSRIGMEVAETPRAWAFCDHVVALGPHATLVVPEATKEQRFAANPLVTGDPGIRFYAGAALTTPEGLNLGTLCVIDTKPRPEPTANDVQRLKTLARVVVGELESRRAARAAEEKERLLELAETMSGVGRWRLDGATHVVTWSDEVYRIHGVERTQFNPNLHDAVAFYHPEDQEAVGAFVARALSHQENFDFQLRLKRADGALRHVVCKAECELDEAGRTTALVGVFKDETDHVLALASTEQALKRVSESEERYRLLTENSHDLIIKIGADETLQYVSPSIKVLLGYEPDDLLGRSPAELVHPEDKERARAAFASAALGREVARGDYRLRHKDGSMVWVDARPRALRDAVTGAIVGVTDVIRDVRERKAAEGALSASEARFRLLADNASDIVTRCDLDGRFQYVSPVVERITGFTPDEVLGRTALELVHPDDRDRVSAEISESLASFQGRQVEHRHITKDGRTIWVQSRPRVARDAAGKAVAITDVMREITERKAAEDAIIESEARYRLLADNATDLILKINQGGVIEYASPAASLLGYAPEEIVGLRRLDLVHPDDHELAGALFEDVVKGGEISQRSRREYRFLHKDGRALWLEGNSALVRDETGRPGVVVSAFRDVSGRRALEDSLAEAKIAAEAATVVKSEFLANMSHEIRTPLTAIIGFTSMLSSRSDLPGAALTPVKRIKGASSALLTLVNDILDFSELEAGQAKIEPKSVDVVALAEDALAMFEVQAQLKSLQLELEAADGVPDYVRLDPDRLRQIILNLVSNAVKFTDAGRVRLRLGYDAGRELLQIKVEDTGPGMDAQQCGRLFQRFSQVDASSSRRHGGTGLGLAICKGLTEAMGGQIRVESQLGGGSVFHLDVDAPPVTATSEVQIGAWQAAELAGLRVLIVDDVAANRELARVILQAYGVETRDAENGAEAVTLANEAPFDVIMMDLHMPGLDGRLAMRRIRSGPGPNADTPIIAFTAERAETLDFGPGGFDGVVGKPISSAEMIRALLEACGEPPVAGSQTPKASRSA